ncbi:M48 family metalloprotease [Flavitalea flava]
MVLQALPYHLKVRDHFKEQKKTWDFFAASHTKEDQITSFKTELLKNTYKFQPGTDPLIYEKIAMAKERLDLGALPVTAYQAHFTDESDLNASIVYLHNEAHLVFSGNLHQRLDEDELLALIAHELTHVKLYTCLGGDLEITERIITSIANHNRSEASYYETARLFRLYTEIYCDRGAYAVVGKAIPVINMLLKIATGLTVVHAENYSKQAEEIFSVSPETRSATQTHPENFIRTRALELWHDQQEAAGPAISLMIEGLPDLDRLDIFARKELTRLTRDFLQNYLRPEWFHSPAVTGLARQYFPDFSWEPPAPLPLAEEISVLPAPLKEYLAYVLLDFALVDPSLEEIPAGRAFHFAGEMQIREVYDPVVKKEFKWSDKKLDQHIQKVLTAYQEVKED